MTSSRARLYKPTRRNLALLAAQLRRGQLVAAPTETVYGLAGNALDARAARRIFAAKGRPSTDPLIVHVATIRQAGNVAELNPQALRLARRFWPGPLTLILPKKPVVPDEVTSGGPSVAVRMPAHPLFLRLIRLSGLPLAAPSANPFGYVSPTTAGHVLDGLSGSIRHVLDGGPCQIGLESTIVDLRDPARPVVLRPGAISAAQLSRCLGCAVPLHRRRVVRGAAVAPGLLKRHYSPKTPVRLHRSITPALLRGASPQEAWLFIRTPRRGSPSNHFGLDPKGTLAGAARMLFSQLRTLDRAGYRVIHVELARGRDGLAAALNDRLRRAAAR